MNGLFDVVVHIIFTEWPVQYKGIKERKKNEHRYSEVVSSIYTYIYV